MKIKTPTEDLTMSAEDRVKTHNEKLKDLISNNLPYKQCQNYRKQFSKDYKIVPSSPKHEHYSVFLPPDTNKTTVNNALDDINSVTTKDFPLRKPPETDVPEISLQDLLAGKCD